MSRTQKVYIGIATVFPLLYLIVVLLTPLRMVFTTDPASPEAPDWFLYFTAFHFFMYLYTVLLLAFYIIHLFGNSSISREVKLIWTLALLIGSVLTMPIYWYLHVWKIRS